MAQKTQQKDAQGRKQGLWTEAGGIYGTLCRGLYKDNLRQGLWKWYSYQSFWDSDIITAGPLYAEVNYVDGLKQGLQKWYRENGDLEAEVNYVDGLKQGLQKWYFKNGNLEMEGHYLNDKRHGLWKQYYLGDTLWQETTYLDGNQQGFQKEYDEDGSYKKISFWKQDELLQENVLLLFLGYIDLIP